MQDESKNGELELRLAGPMPGVPVEEGGPQLPVSIGFDRAQKWTPFDCGTPTLSQEGREMSHHYCTPML